MRSWRTERGFILRLDKGEEIVSSLSLFFEKQGMGFASVNGIGAASEAVLAVFDTKKREYITRRFEGDLEIISLMGNIMIAEGRPKVHLHACISGHDYLARSGHLVSGIVSVTCELVLGVSDAKVERRKDDVTGLMLID